MIKEATAEYRPTSDMPSPHPMPRGQAMTELVELGYSSDSKNWLGLLRLLEKGYIKPRDLQDHPR